MKFLKFVVKIRNIILNNILKYESINKEFNNNSAKNEPSCPVIPVTNAIFFVLSVRFSLLYLLPYYNVFDLLYTVFIICRYVGITLIQTTYM